MYAIPTLLLHSLINRTELWWLNKDEESNENIILGKVRKYIKFMGETFPYFYLTSVKVVYWTTETKLE